MTTLYWILAATLLGSTLSVVASAAIAYLARPHWIGRLVSFAVGALLAAVFVEILPHAFGGHDHHQPVVTAEQAEASVHPSHSALSVPSLEDDADADHEHSESEEADHSHHESHPDSSAILLTILLGILVFFILEKLVIWRHCHLEECEGHSFKGYDHGRSGMMIMIGDTFHNLLDGALIGAAFSSGEAVGIATAFAIIAHEIPQEVGDFVILLHSGYSKRKALLLNLVSSFAAVLGGVFAWWSISVVQTIQPYLLALGAASMIYVAIADLIPSLHKHPRIKDTIQQIGLIAAGVVAIALPHFLFAH